MFNLWSMFNPISMVNSLSVLPIANIRQSAGNQYGVIVHPIVETESTVNVKPIIDAEITVSL
jgi:hypothetical protein